MHERLDSTAFHAWIVFVIGDEASDGTLVIIQTAIPANVII